MKARNNTYCILLITVCFVTLVILRSAVIAKPAMSATLALQMPHMNFKPVMGEFQKPNKKNKAQTNLPLTLGTKTKAKGVTTYRSPLAEQMYQSTQITRSQNKTSLVMEKSIMNSSDKEDNIVIRELQYQQLDSVDVTRLSELRSHSTYLVTRTNCEEELEDLTIYYWIGKYSKRTEAAEVAAYAVQLDSNAHKKGVKLSREVEGKESEAFKALFEQDEVNIEFNKNIPTKSSAKSKRMFLISGKDDINYKEVKPLLSNVPEKDKCMVFISKKAYVFCAPEASIRQEQVAKKLASSILQKRGVEDPEIIYYKNKERLWEVSQYTRLGLKQLWDDIENIPKDIAEKEIVVDPEEFTPKESRKILDQTKTLENGQEIFYYTTATRFYLNALNEVDEIKIPYNDLSRSKLNPKDSYLINSRSNVGLFVWIGNKSDARVRIECAKRAELLNGMYYSCLESIKYVGPDDVLHVTQDVQEMIRFLDPTKHQDMEPSTPDQVIKNKMLEENTSKVSKVVKRKRKNKLIKTNLENYAPVSKTESPNINQLIKNSRLKDRSILETTTQNMSELTESSKLEENMSVFEVVTETEDNISMSKTTQENITKLEENTNLKEREIVTRIQKGNKRMKPITKRNSEENISVFETMTVNTSSVEENISSEESVHSISTSESTIEKNTSYLEENTNLKEDTIVTEVQKKKNRKKPVKNANLENYARLSRAATPNINQLIRNPRLNDGSILGTTTQNMSELTESSKLEENMSVYEVVTETEDNISMSKTTQENITKLEENTNLKESEIVTRVQKGNKRMKPIKKRNSEENISVFETVTVNESSVEENTSSKESVHNISTSESVIEKNTSNLEENTNLKEDIITTVTEVQKKKTRKKPVKNTNLENDVSISKTVIENTNKMEESTITKLEDKVSVRLDPKKSERKYVKNFNLENDISASHAENKNTINSLEIAKLEENSSTSKVTTKNVNKKLIKNSNLESDVFTSDIAMPTTNLTPDDLRLENNAIMLNFDMVKKNTNSGPEKEEFLSKTVGQPMSMPVRKRGRPKKNILKSD